MQKVTVHAGVLLSYRVHARYYTVSASAPHDVIYVSLNIRSMFILSKKKKIDTQKKEGQSEGYGSGSVSFLFQYYD